MDNASGYTNYDPDAKWGTLAPILGHLFTLAVSYILINYKSWRPGNYCDKTTTIHNIVLML